MKIPRGSRLEAAVRAALARQPAALRRPLDAPQTARPPRTAGGSPPTPPSPAAASGLVQRSGRSLHVERLVVQIALRGLPPPRWAGSPGGEVRPIPGRRFRLDLAWPEARVYCEVDGGAWSGGRHARGGGIRTDAEKTSLLAGLGWLHVRTDDFWIRKGVAVGWIAAALAARGALREKPAEQP